MANDRSWFSKSKSSDMSFIDSFSATQSSIEARLSTEARVDRILIFYFQPNDHCLEIKSYIGIHEARSD